MLNAVRRIWFPTKSFSSNYLCRRLLSKRVHIITARPFRWAPQGRNTALVLVGTVLLSATSGYFLATHELQKSGSTGRTEEAHEFGPDNSQYGTANDFRKAIEELRETFPEPAAVSDDPDVLGPYGFSENDYHPGIPCFLANVYSAENLRI